MRSATMFVIALVLVCQTAAAETPAEIFKRASPSVVVVESLDAKGSVTAFGSGVVMAPGRVVTNRHVIEDGVIYRVERDGTTWRAKLIRVDSDHDLAELSVTGLTAPAANVRASSSLAVGEKVYAIGAPEGLELTISEGLISGLRDFDKSRVIQTSAAISPGSSGGGLFDAQGRLVGITTLYLKEGQTLNFALPADRALPLNRLPERGSAEARTGTSAPHTAHDVDASPSASANMPDLTTTVEFMGRMVESEHRLILLGQLEGAELHSPTGQIVTIVSNQYMYVVLPTGVTQKNGYPEFLYSFYFDDSHDEQKDYPRYMSFPLASIDPSSIESKEGGYDPYALSEFLNKHPKCEADPQCDQEYMSFLDSAPKLTLVQFHTTDLKPLIQRGGCSKTGDCALTETTGRGLILFKSKDRADRFVAAFTHAVKLEGGRPDMFPPTR